MAAVVDRVARLHGLALLIVLTTVVACASTVRSSTVPDPVANAPRTIRYKLDAQVAGQPQGALAIRGTAAELVLDDPRGTSVGTIERGDVTWMRLGALGTLACSDDADGLTCTCRDERARRWGGDGALRFERLTTHLADR